MIATTLEQSRKLVEIGIDLNTADMHYAFTMIGGGAFQEMIDNSATLLPGKKNTKYPYEPAWSLSALLELMPKLYEFENDPDDGGCQPNLCKGWDNNQWHIVYRSSIYITEWYDDPVDAAFDMVCWLLENKKI